MLKVLVKKGRGSAVIIAGENNIKINNMGKAFIVLACLLASFILAVFLYNNHTIDYTNSPHEIQISDTVSCQESGGIYFEGYECLNVTIGSCFKGCQCPQGNILDDGACYSCKHSVDCEKGGDVASQCIAGSCVEFNTGYDDLVWEGRGGVSLERVNTKTVPNDDVFIQTELDSIHTSQKIKSTIFNNSNRDIIVQLFCKQPYSALLQKVYWGNIDWKNIKETEWSNNEWAVIPTLQIKKCEANSLLIPKGEAHKFNTGGDIIYPNKLSDGVYKLKSFYSVDFNDNEIVNLGDMKASQVIYSNYFAVYNTFPSKFVIKVVPTEVINKNSPPSNISWNIYVGDFKFNNLYEVKSFLAILPEKTEIEFSPSDDVIGNEPLNASKESINNFKLFCAKHNLKLTIIPGG